MKVEKKGQPGAAKRTQPTVPTTPRPAAPNKPTIKILLYTDNPLIAPTDDFGEFFGLGSMIERLQDHAPTFANIDVRWFSRNSDDDNQANNKLNDLLNREAATGEPFDEIWFFGLHQSNTDRFSLLARLGGPESELNDDEITALTEWMNVHGGGVLMTGDHSNETPASVVADNNGHYADPVAIPEFLGLGRALGRCVPRAGSLRKWEGPPTYHAADSLSTIGDSGFQTDHVPQQLQLLTVDEDGDPDPAGQPHPLFFYRGGEFIEVFPDHAHEGAVIIPDETAPLDPDVWPIGVDGRQPRPHVVALGRDARKPDPLNIVATYDGDLGGVGRIVADSTWHHYMNLNLRGFPQSAPVGSASDQMGQFYANLAVWLAPKSKRQEMARLMLWRLARYTQALQERDNADRTGATAQSVLATVCSDCEIHELIHAYTPRAVTELYKKARKRELPLPSRQAIVGEVLKQYQTKITEADTAPYPETIDVDKVIKTGIAVAFKRHEVRVKETLAALPRPNGGSNGTSHIKEITPERTITMACTEPNEEWTIETITDPRPGRPSVEGILVFCLSFDGEIISGRVADGESGEFLSDVNGTLQSLGPLGLDDEAFLMSLNFSNGPREVAMSGVKFARNFRGRFTSFVAAAEMAVTGTSSRRMGVAALSPGDGDTGTASGTQT